MYLPSYNLAFYKYNICELRVNRFDFSQPKLLNLKIEFNRTNWLKRDNLWLNSWSPAIASLIQSNHDINFIISNIKTLALIYYIRNYVIKSNYVNIKEL